MPLHIIFHIFADTSIKGIIASIAIISTTINY